MCVNRARVRVAAIALMCSGCRASDPGMTAPVMLDVNVRSIVAGESVAVTLRNVSRATRTYGNPHCRIVLQRFDKPDDKWLIAGAASRGCTLEARTLAPDARDTVSVRIACTLLPGRYRLVMSSTQRMGTSAEEWSYSPSFDVRAPLRPCSQ